MNKGYLLVLLTAIISGFSIFINKFGVSVIDPFVFTWLKNTVVALLLTGIIMLLKDWRLIKKITGRQWQILALIGVVGGAVPFLLFFKGLSLTSAVQGGFIHKTMFIYVAVLALLFLKEKIDKRFLIGVFFLILGNIFLLNKFSFSPNMGDLLILAAAFLWAVESVISKYALKNLEGRTVAWARMSFGSLFIFLFLGATGRLGAVSGITASQIGWVAVTSVLLFGYVMTWYSGLKYIPVSSAVVILFLGSPITTLLSLASGGAIPVSEILSGALIVVGVCCVIGLRRIIMMARNVKQFFYARA